MIRFYFLHLLISLAYQIEINILDPQNQVYYQTQLLKDDDFTMNNFLVYGLWSKYNPLSNIRQTGEVGMFESDCFQLHNAISIYNKSLNLIYYDCLNYQTKKIFKEIQFIDNINEQNNLKANIDVFEYENIWYFFGIFQQPNLNKLEIIIQTLSKIILRKILQAKLPFSDMELQLTFGGSLIVGNSKIDMIKEGTKFSYFPGSIIVGEFIIDKKQPKFDIDTYSMFILGSQAYCQCQQNEDSQIPDIDLNQLNQRIYLSENLNCDFFLLQGWIKITESVSFSGEFVYQLIKLTSNIENSQLSNQNLSPFQLFYQISNQQNQIIVTTYSYTFPSVTLDFSNDPFLIVKEFNIQDELSLWHKLEVQNKENNINVQISFYKDGNFYSSYSHDFNVLLFKRNQFKLEYGNLLQDSMNYLNFELRSFVFTICDQNLENQICHQSCKTCDGYQDENCLTCSEESQRIFQLKSKACVCPYNTIDIGTCYSLNDSQFELIEDKGIRNQCQYGYFEFEYECLRCPSIIRKDFITCLECLQQPKTWSMYPICETTLYTNLDGSVSEQTNDIDFNYYVYDGVDLSYAIFQQEYTVKLSNWMIDYEQKILRFKHFCSFDKPECYKCILPGCYKCHLSIEGLKCVQSQIGQQQVNDYMLPSSFNMLVPCLSPNYITFNKICKLCPIKNCKYCFDYVDSDLSKCTLYKNFQKFEEESMKVGCALCQKNYSFDFTLNLCKQIEPQIQNCLRSFINLEGQEVCTLSSINDFSISPEVLNCQQYYSYCLQCILLPDQTIQCIICQPGYTNSQQGGGCYSNTKPNAITVIQGDIYDQDAWVWLVQSFIMQFLPNQYYYPKTYNIQEIPIECQEGYEVSIFGECIKQCSFDCKICKKFMDYMFICKKCSLNLLKLPIKNQKQGQCVTCPQLCEVCSDSQQDDGQTQLCLKPIYDAHVTIDPYLQKAKYCFTENCFTHFKLTVIQKLNDYCFLTYFETIIAIDEMQITYSNMVGVDQITIAFFINNFSEEITCKLHQDFYPILQTNLKNQIASLQYVKIHLSTISINSIFELKQAFEFHNYDQIQISEMRFSNVQTFILKNQQQKIELNLINLRIEDSIISGSSTFQTEFFGKITLINVTLSNLNLLNNSFINLEQSKFDGILEIDSLTIQNCVLNNTNLFILANNYITMFAKRIIIDQCQVYNSSFFMFYSNNEHFQNLINFDNIIIKKTKFESSYFINCFNRFKVIINEFNFFQNYVMMSKIISFDYQLELFQSKTNQNTFIQSLFTTTNSILRQDKIICILDNYQCKQNYLQESILFQIFSTYTINYVFFNITNIEITEINSLHQIGTNQQLQLFKIHGNQLLIKNAKVEKIMNSIAFFILDNQEILIENVILENKDEMFKIPLSMKCIDKLQQKSSQFLQVIGFKSLIIKNVQINRQISVDYSLIEVSFGRQYFNYSFGIIIIQNVSFEDNKILKLKQVDLFSLLSIYSSDEIKILINNITFKLNILHQSVNDPLETSSGLMSIQTLISTLEINNLFCYLNALTNSSTSFISLTSSDIKITNYTVINHNLLSQDIWERFFDFQFELDEDQENINLIIQNTIKILNKGGGGQIVASKFQCTDCYFEKILAQKSAIFEIKTQFEGAITFRNLTAKQIQTNLQQTGSGCITIYSQLSILNLNIIGSIFSDIFNRFSSSILTIQPSLQQNTIILNKIEIKNCISLINQFFSFQFNSLTYQANYVEIIDLIAIQTEDVQIKYLTQIGIITSTEMQFIMSNSNAVIYIDESTITIRKVFFEGIYLSPIFIFNNPVILKMNKFQIYSIQTFNPSGLIQIFQKKGIESQIQLDSVSIIKTSAFQLKSNLTFQFKEVDYSITGCKLYKNSTQKFYQISINDILKEFTNFVQEFSALIYISMKSNHHSVAFQNINIQDNNCTFCSNGIIYFKIENLQLLRIRDFRCSQNIILEYGCIHFFSNPQIYPKISIKNSNFIDNKGGSGVAIMANYTFLQLEFCQIVQNQANFSGGGIYLQAINNNFKIKESIILFNKAREGGGLFINGENNLNDNNFIQSYLLENIASLYGNQIVEAPNHIALSINGKEMNSQPYIINNTQTNILNLKPYIIIEQGITLISNILMLPSNQQILNYQIYQPRFQGHIIYIYDFTLYLKNSRNEWLKNKFNSTCIISQSKSYGQELINLDQRQEKANIKFDTQNNNFNLGQLSLTLNPYQEQNEKLLIQLSCRLADSNKYLDYVIQTKGLKCQLGEYLIDDGCQICQSLQGFYSVTYNATKCSVFDKAKFQSITSNQLQLLKGYWRPNHLSDSTDYCFKNPKFCLGGWKVGNDLCSLGHIGGLCEECDVYNIRGDGQFFKTSNENMCLICFGDYDSILPFILTLIWALLSTFLTLKSIKQTNKLFTNFKLSQKHFSIIFKLNQDRESIFFKMLLNYVWIYSVIFTFNITFSFSFIFVNEASNTTYFMANNLDCYLSLINFGNLIYSRIIAMLILILLQFLIILILSLITFYLTKQKIYPYETISNTLIYLYLSNFGGLIKMFFSVLSKRVISNQNFIQGDVALEFGSQTHFNWIYILIIPGLGLFCILIPCFLFILMYKLKGQFDSIRLRKHICYLFNEYDSKNYFWELIKLIKKTIIILVLTYFETQIFLKISLLGLCLLLYQLLIVKHKPYTIKSLNHLDLESGQICSIAIFLATTKYICEQDNNFVFSMILQIIIIILCIKLCFPFLLGIIILYKKKYQTLLFNLLYSFFSLINKHSKLSKIFQQLLKKLELNEARRKNNLVKLKFLLLSQISIRKQKSLANRISLESNIHQDFHSQSKMFLVRSIN
ncbi:unnamed protein product [Paramecium sonneborni]|uniref:Transmembrane protein n=1 Tax=Paramecium sonneborni TaxID=65129 RepID=A0A8S1PGY0_9CILI|nr:unnamed protein product [Paramecium sonneborni]